MSEIMTFEEIKQNYDGEWVLIAYTETNENLEVIKGKVLAHSPHKEDIYQDLESTTEQPLAIEYIGQVPEDLGFIL
ncbi:MAG: hypothetical protein QNJ70_18315 [Xenococcaceae cyanobacterium MO_207.B15]|nr:hypothetical protein [Xenococcaceae cyanobacterium MO_207.B15]MDJ0745913.1 hypothetical protein [Xenococcaceae cyanobacterium MO_167.B27]